MSTLNELERRIERLEARVFATERAAEDRWTSREARVKELERQIAELTQVVGSAPQSMVAELNRLRQEIETGLEMPRVVL